MALLAKLNPRVLLLLMVGIACLVAFEAWVLALAKPLAQYRQLTVSRSALATTLAASGRKYRELAGLEAEIKALSARLTGELHAAGSADQIAAGLMSQLDRTAASGGITLAGIKPGARRQVLNFEELAFEIRAQGKYLTLSEWLLNFERTLGQNATVTEFDMKSADSGRLVAVTLKVALYRPLPFAGAAK